MIKKINFSVDQEDRPPSISIVCPEIKEASFFNKNSTKPTTSSIFPALPSGVLLIICFNLLGAIFFFAFFSIEILKNLDFRF